MWSSGLLFVAVFAAAPDDGEAHALVEIPRSSGVLRAANTQDPHWERVRVSLQVNNRLDRAVHHLEVEIAMFASTVRGRDVGVSRIPGWKIRNNFGSLQVPPGVSEALYVDRPLPPQRRALAAREITYRARVIGYRLVEPRLDDALLLLQSGAPADQAAALGSFSQANARGPVITELRKGLTDLPAAPGPSDALRLLLALRASAELAAPSLVGSILLLPERVDARTWGRAIIELARRVVDGSDRTDPRLSLLPTWARNAFDIQHRVDGAVRDVVREAILRVGDRAVPALVRAAHRGRRADTRVEAAGLLHALGRSTPRQQLALPQRDDVLRVVEVFGDIGAPETVSALAELIPTRDADLRRAVLFALQRIGAPAVQPLVEALTIVEPDTRAAIVSVLDGMGPAARPQLVRHASRYGVGQTSSVAFALSEKLSALARLRRTREIQRALELGATGRYDDAFRMLDRVYAADAELYMRHAHPIATMYLRRARGLHERGNHDAAAMTLQIGASVAALPEAADLQADIQLALARGYLELGDLEQAQRALGRAEAAGDGAGEVRGLRARLLQRRAERAYREGDHGLARNLIDRASALAPLDPEVDRIRAMVFVRENVVMLIVLGLIIPATLISIAVRVRRRLQASRIARIVGDTVSAPGSSE